MTYDVRNQKVREEAPEVMDAMTGNPARPTVDTVYDAVGNVVAVIDARGMTTNTEYDWANRKVRVVAPAVPVGAGAPGLPRRRGRRMIRRAMCSR